jgi:hypothetical protein
MISSPLFFSHFSSPGFITLTKSSASAYTRSRGPLLRTNQNNLEEAISSCASWIARKHKSLSQISFPLRCFPYGACVAGARPDTACQFRCVPVQHPALSLSEQGTCNPLLAPSSGSRKLGRSHTQGFSPPPSKTSQAPPSVLFFIFTSPSPTGARGRSAIL